MKTAAELKLAARKALLGNYGNASGAVLLIYLFGMLLMIPFIVIILITGLIADAGNLGITALIPVVVIMAFAYVIVSLLLMVGYVRLCYRIAIGEEGDLNDLFFAVKTNLPRYLGLMGLLTVCYILSSLPGLLAMNLFTVGGYMGIGFLLGYALVLVIPIAVLCRYAMALFALVENPQMRVMEAMRFSRDLMQGNIWRMIRLEFSFFGMILLMYMTLGIGYIWLMPYLVCTNVLFYLTIKEEKYPTVYKTAEEEAMEARFNEISENLPTSAGGEMNH